MAFNSKQLHMMTEDSSPENTQALEHAEDI
jgi:hypothetical protein